MINGKEEKMPPRTELTEDELARSKQLDRETENEKRYYERIGERAELWNSIIDGSRIHGDFKMTFKSIISKMENARFGDALRLRDIIAAVAEDLLKLSVRAAVSYKSRPEAREEVETVIDSVKDDILAFHKEITS